MSDGGANIECELTSEEINMLLDYAINKILKDYMKTLKEETKNE